MKKFRIALANTKFKKVYKTLKKPQMKFCIIVFKSHIWVKLKNLESESESEGLLWGFIRFEVSNSFF